MCGLGELLARGHSFWRVSRLSFNVASDGHSVAFCTGNWCGGAGDVQHRLRYQADSPKLVRTRLGGLSG